MPIAHSLLPVSQIDTAHHHQNQKIQHSILGDIPMPTNPTVDQKQRRPLLTELNAFRVQKFAELSNRNPSEATNVLIERGWEVVSVKRTAEAMPKAPGYDPEAAHTTSSY